jgi:acetyltransferase-like isoleucine patch superfamily enzyme
MTHIHPMAIVEAGARLGASVRVGPFSIVHNNVEIGDGTTVEAYCELGVPSKLANGSPLKIGRNSLIRSHSVFYESSTFGDNLITGHGATIREHTNAGKGFQIGTQNEIQGDCSIGDYVRFQSNVFIGKMSRIGNFVWMLPYSMLTNDPTPPSDTLIGCTLEDYVVIAASAVVLPGVTVHRHAVVAACACVTKDVAPGTIVAGVPAQKRGAAESIKLRDGSDSSAYPWTNHFKRGYPEQVVAEWRRADGSQ